jgi:hypothetical protein
MDTLLIPTRFLLFVLPKDPGRRPPAIGWRRALVMYVVSIYAVVVVFYIARAQQLLIRMEPLQNIDYFVHIIPKLPFLPSKCRDYALLSAHCRN